MYEMEKRKRAESLRRERERGGRDRYSKKEREGDRKCNSMENSFWFCLFAVSFFVCFFVVVFFGDEYDWV